MVYDSNSRRDYTGGPADMDYGRDYGSGRDYAYSSARDYEATGEYGNEGRRGYGGRDYGNQRYGQREQMGRGRDYGRGRGGGETYGSGGDYYGGSRGGYQGAYGSDGRPFDDYGSERWRSDDRNAGRERSGNSGDRARGGYGRQPQGYSYEDRGFLARAGDEVRSWFGDDDAERRRDQDACMDERYANDRDSDYHSWRRGQIDALDRDYHEYRQENRSKFESEFATWRTARQGQRDSLSSVKEHMDVVGSDGGHVGTVDKVRGDRILLTKNDADAGGRHHSIPSRWIDKVADKVTLSKTAAEAKQAWHDEENRQALSGWGDRIDGDRGQDRSRDQDRDQGRGGTNLNRSFSGTY